MDQYLAQIRVIAGDTDWIGMSAQNVLNFVQLYQTGELPRDSVIHNLQTIQKRTVHDITLPEFERKLGLDSLVFQVLSEV